ncbi:unnamed protein product [Adineta steineri]|uniref:G-protein coupled receptors family 1 profile domain-containing protein n=1 Tax=Adineta steineri TaxID=433720 RepID=A0A814RS78_9BILA|nr:unnamed protein product [Adineta steineri]CAF1137599.1 unnamed protein product [Adineta steineri]CAF1140779.1 unnamed protein product [Adineta steineri]
MDNNNNSITSLNTTSETNVIVYVCIHFVMPSAVAIGIIGNLLSILVFARREMIKFCVSIFTIVLALSDILLLTTSLFNIILPEFVGGLLSDKSAFWCHFHGYFDLLFAALSGYSVVFISVERWFSVWKPFDKAKYVTFKTTLITVITYTLISSFVFSWFPLILRYVPTSNAAHTCDLFKPMIYKIFGTISVIYTYIIPFIFLGILNILICYRLHTRQQTSIQQSLKTANNKNRNESSSASASVRKRIQRQRNTDRNITVMLITVAIAFMVMSFPFQIYWFYMQIRQLKEPNATLFTLTQTFRYLNCCCNFFLYSATSSLFRRELQQIFQCSNALKSKYKSTSSNVTNRTKIISSSAVFSANYDHMATDRKTLLSKAAAESLNNINLTNGHHVSFKTNV